MVSFMDFYKDKKVLITGGLGFLGSNLAISLVNLGAKVTLFDAMLPLYGGNFFNIEEIRDKIEVNGINKTTSEKYLLYMSEVMN